jgi:spermidine synthase
VEWRKRALDTGFSDARYGSIAISSYPTGQIGFLLCRKSPSSSPSMENVVKRYNRIKETSYYQPKLQESAFSLPLWVERRIYQTGGASEGDDIDILEVDPNGDILNWDIIAKSLR